MSEQQTITIDNEEHNVSDLTVETQMHVARVAELRREISQMQMQIQEREVLLNAYSNAIVESVKAVEDMYAPVSGEIVHRNNSVLASPEELQNDPHGEGWLLIIRPDNPAQLNELMDSETYSKKISA